jgi:succinate dehydrogenase / fumarate reductase cytochrome b subunit
MAASDRGVLRSSVVRKQIIAVTGLAMIGFLVAHLSGNLLIYGGPELFNAYAHKVASFGPLLWVMRAGLIAAFIVHVWLTVTLWRENRVARPQGYEVDSPKGNRSFATTTMRYTGILVAAFLILHLSDFTFGSKSGPQSVVPSVEPDSSQELFGLVWNSFKSAGGIWRVPFYVSHAIQSVFQTFGFNHAKYTPLIKIASVIIGAGIAAAFASIPIYITLFSKPLGY